MERISTLLSSGYGLQTMLFGMWAAQLRWLALMMVFLNAFGRIPLLFEIIWSTIFAMTTRTPASDPWRLKFSESIASLLTITIFCIRPALVIWSRRRRTGSLFLPTIFFRLEWA